MLHYKVELPLQLHLSLGCVGALAKAQNREGALKALLGRGQQAPCSEEVPGGYTCWLLYLCGNKLR